MMLWMLALDLGRRAAGVKGVENDFDVPEAVDGVAVGGDEGCVVGHPVVFWLEGNQWTTAWDAVG